MVAILRRKMIATTLFIIRALTKAAFWQGVEWGAEREPNGEPKGSRMGSRKGAEWKPEKKYTTGGQTPSEPHGGKERVFPSSPGERYFYIHRNRWDKPGLV